MDVRQTVQGRSLGGDTKLYMRTLRRRSVMLSRGDVTNYAMRVYGRGRGGGTVIGNQVSEGGFAIFPALGTSFDVNSERRLRYCRA